MESIVGIVLAAGRSRRMGRPKAFLEIGGETFLARAISSLRGGGCGAVVVVTGSAEDDEQAAIARAARDAGASVVINNSPASEQLDSLRIAIRAVSVGVAAAVVTPVDVPNPRASTVEAMIGRFRDSGAALVVPSHDGARGHPILIDRRLFPEIISADLPEGVRSLIRAHDAEVVEVPVEDLDVLLDIDTPLEYRSLLERSD